MSGGQRLLFELLLDRRWQCQQSQGIGDVAAALADGLGDLCLATAELVHQAAVGFRLLQRRQILALQILDEGDLEHLGIAERPDDDRHLVQPGALRGAPAPLAGDQLKIGARLAALALHRPHEQGLDHAFFADRLNQPVELGFGEAPARLERRWADRLDRHGARCSRAGQNPRAALAEQRRQAPAEGRPFRPVAHAAASAPVPRRIISPASWI